jgi:hypothetical protein
MGSNTTGIGANLVKLGINISPQCRSCHIRLNQCPTTKPQRIWWHDNVIAVVKDKIMDTDYMNSLS